MRAVMKQALQHAATVVVMKPLTHCHVGSMTTRFGSAFYIVTWSQSRERFVIEKSMHPVFPVAVLLLQLSAYTTLRLHGTPIIAKYDGTPIIQQVLHADNFDTVVNCSQQWYVHCMQEKRASCDVTLPRSFRSAIAMCSDRPHAWKSWMIPPVYLQKTY